MTDDAVVLVLEFMKSVATGDITDVSKLGVKDGVLIVRFSYNR